MNDINATELSMQVTQQTQKLQVPVQPAIDTISIPLSQYEALKKHLEQNRFDSVSWNKLIDLAEKSGDLETIKQAYETLLSAHPNIADVQIAYLNHFMRPGLYPHAEVLFNRFLRPSPSVSLWKYYLSYVRCMNANPSTQDTVIKNYEFSLLYIGHDKDSGEIWREYIDFIKAGETHTTWEEQRKMYTLRQVYQRAVQIPLENLEQLWCEYNTFEVLNDITAPNFIENLSKAYMTAKQVLKQVRMHLALCTPPVPAFTKPGRKPFDLSEPLSPQNECHRMLVKSWRAYLQWEEKNPLEIEDKSVYNARVYATYKKAVVLMRFNPESWYMAYTWIEKNIKQDEALAYLKDGLDAKPESFVLNFVYAEALEAAKAYSEVHKLFNKFINLLCCGLEKQTPAALEESLKRRAELSIVWIAYIRFAVRANGLKSARTVYGKAMRDKWIGWEVYEATALLEYRLTKLTNIAIRIYEIGLAKFQDEPEYVLQYLKFLISVNDKINAPVLFERMVGKFTPDKARLLWETWVVHEYNYGDLKLAIELEKRISAIYPEDSSMRRVAHRHMCGNYDPIAERDLGYVLR